MATEPVFLSPEAKKRLIREATQRNMSLDDYMAELAASRPIPTRPEASPSGSRPATGARSERVREMLDQMTDMYMMRSLSSGVMPPGLGDSGNSPAMQQLNERFERLEDRLDHQGGAPADDDMDLRSIMRQAVRIRMMAPILKSIGSDDEGSSSSKLFREYEKELRDKLDKTRDEMVRELRDRDKELAGVKDKQYEERLREQREQGLALLARIDDLQDRMTSAPPQSQANIATQLTEALTQAQAVQSALAQIGRANAPQLPAAGEQSTVQTIAFLANELSGAVSKGLEAVAKVNAAQRGHNPDLMGHMPPPGTPPPVYQPRYVQEPATRGSPPMAGPPGTPAGARPAGPRLFFEGAPPTPAPGAPQAPAAPTPGATSLPPLAPLDASVTQFLSPTGAPISRDEFQAIRMQEYQRTGRDPLQLYEQPPAGAAPAETPPAPAGSGEVTARGDTESTPAEGAASNPDTSEGE